MAGLGVCGRGSDYPSLETFSQSSRQCHIGYDHQQGDRYWRVVAALDHPSHLEDTANNEDLEAAVLTAWSCHDCLLDGAPRLKEVYVVDSAKYTSHALNRIGVAGTMARQVTRGLVGYETMSPTAGRLVVAFRVGELRGTDLVPLARYFPTLPTFPMAEMEVDFQSALVHSGAADEYFSGVGVRVAEELQFAMRRHRGQIREVVFTGGDLGGIVATLAAFDFAVTNSRSPLAPSVNGYTFDSPKVGNLAFASLYNRLVNHWTLSYRPRLPPTSTPGMWHVGRGIWYKDNADHLRRHNEFHVYQCCSAENPACSHFVPAPDALTKTGLHSFSAVFNLGPTLPIFFPREISYKSTAFKDIVLAD